MQKKVSAKRIQNLIKNLENNPDLLEQLEGIIDLCNEPEQNGRIRKIDEIENILLIQTRKLGVSTIESWASKVEEIVINEARLEDKETQIREKKT